MGLDFNMIASLLPSHCGFFFVFGHGHLFLMGSAVRLYMAVQQLAVILVLAGGDECVSFYAIILNRISQLVLILCIHLFPFAV